MNPETSPPILPDSSVPPRARLTFGRLMLVGVFALLALLVLFHLIENGRGKRSWEKHKRELEARGERFELAAFVPPQVPDEENFAATPYLAALFFGRPSVNNVSDRWPTDYSEAEKESRRVSKRSTTRGSGAARELTDLPAWQLAFEKARGELTEDQPRPAVADEAQARARAAAAVLDALKVYEPVLEELRAASSRPHARFNVKYDLENPFGILLPHLAVVRRTCQLLKLKATAELAAGQADRAFHDLQLMLRLSDSISGEPFIISSMVEQACLNIAADVLWEGLAQRRWSEQHLAETQARLEALDFLGQMQRGLRAERAAGVGTIDQVRRRPALFETLTDGGGGSPKSPFVPLAAKLVPQGWFYMEQLNYSRLMEEGVLAGFDPRAKRVDPARARKSEQTLKKMGSKPADSVLRHVVFARLLLPALSKTQQKTARAQTLADHAALACALERYRLTHGQLQDKLEALVPQFITKVPHDTVTGELLRYQRVGQSGFELHSAGWDETDGGGDITRLDSGEWSWRQPSGE